MIPLTLVTLLIFIFDLITKFLVRKNMPLGREIEILPFFSIVHVENTGIAFGLFQDNNLLFLLVGLVVACAMFFLARKMLSQDKPGAFLVAVVLGGAFGNLTDRFFRGRVTDFLDFYWGAYHWPAFNVADAAICVGATLLILRELFQKKNVPSPL